MTQLELCVQTPSELSFSVWLKHVPFARLLLYKKVSVPVSLFWEGKKRFI